MEVEDAASEEVSAISSDSSDSEFVPPAGVAAVNPPKRHRAVRVTADEIAGELLSASEKAIAAFKARDRKLYNDADYPSDEEEGEEILDDEPRSGDETEYTGASLPPGFAVAPNRSADGGHAGGATGAKGKPAAKPRKPRAAGGAAAVRVGVAAGAAKAARKPKPVGVAAAARRTTGGGAKLAVAGSKSKPVSGVKVGGGGAGAPGGRLVAKLGGKAKPGANGGVKSKPRVAGGAAAGGAKPKSHGGVTAMAKVAKEWKKAIKEARVKTQKTNTKTSRA